MEYIYYNRKLYTKKSEYGIYSNKILKIGWLKAVRIKVIDK